MCASNLNELTMVNIKGRRDVIDTGEGRETSLIFYVILPVPFFYICTVLTLVGIYSFMFLLFLYPLESQTCVELNIKLQNLCCPSYLKGIHVNVNERTAPIPT